MIKYYSENGMLEVSKDIFDLAMKEKDERDKAAIENLANNCIKNDLIEYVSSNGEFKSTKDVRSYILDNRDEIKGYIQRSNNNWDDDVVYLWKELLNGKIIWIKTKA